jgi:RNA polymerase sigma-B factor
MTVDSLLAVLPDHERTVVRLRFQDGMSQTAIAKVVGSSQMHVSRVLRRALDRLREAIDEEG